MWHSLGLSCEVWQFKIICYFLWFLNEFQRFIIASQKLFYLFLMICTLCVQKAALCCACTFMLKKSSVKWRQYSYFTVVWYSDAFMLLVTYSSFFIPIMFWFWLALLCEETNHELFIMLGAASVICTYISKLWSALHNCAHPGNLYLTYICIFLIVHVQKYFRSWMSF